MDERAEQIGKKPENLLKRLNSGILYLYDRNTEDRRGIKDEVRVSASDGGGYSKVKAVFLSQAQQDM